MIFLDIIISRGVIAPEELQAFLAALPIPAGGQEGVVLSGRMPVWAFAALAHHFHGRPWVATFDPRLAGGVVVFSHTPEKSVGDVVVVIDGAKVDFEWGGTNAS